MNTNNFRKFVETLEALPQDIKNREVETRTIFKPLPATIDCFTGLISIVAEDIPELKELHEGNPHGIFLWEYTLDDFLECAFPHWAWANRDFWGNPDGLGMHEYKEAFGKKKDEVLTNNDIILHLRRAFDRWVNRDKSTQTLIEEKIDHEYDNNKGAVE